MREHCKLPSGSGHSPAAKQFLMHFEVKTPPLPTFVLNGFWPVRGYSRQNSCSVTVLAGLGFNVKRCAINVRV